MKLLSLDGAKIANKDARHTAIARPWNRRRFFLRERQSTVIAATQDKMLARELLKISNEIATTRANPRRPRRPRDSATSTLHSSSPDIIAMTNPSEFVFPHGSKPRTK